MSLKKHIPNSITSMNLLSGIIGVIFTLSYGDIRTALLCMIAAAFFDFFDGLAARALGAYSDTGKELDSLSDVVSFGVLPSLMLFESMACQRVGADFWCFVVLILAVGTALRLAKFNLDERQHDSFLGLPSPACALFAGSLAVYILSSRTSPVASLSGTFWFLPLAAITLSLLMVSEIPFFSMKFGKGKMTTRSTMVKRMVFLAIAVFVTVYVAVLRLDWTIIPLMVFAVYIILNLLFALFPNNSLREG